MELNEQSAIERNMQDILSAKSAREEAEILAAIQSESEMADISDVDNGYRKITRTFFSAAHATKDINEERKAELAKEESEEKTRNIFQSMVQDIIERNREFQEEIYQGIQKNLDQARREVVRHEQLLAEIEEKLNQQQEKADALKSEEEDAAIDAEAAEEVAEERQAELEQAQAFQATCSVAANLESCKTEMGMENATEQEMQDRLSDSVTAAEIGVQDAQEMKQIANDNRAAAEQKTANAENDVKETEQQKKMAVRSLSRAKTKEASLETQMDETKQKTEEFTRNLEADVKSGKITPEQAEQRRIEFKDNLLKQANAADPSKTQPVVAANNDAPNASRPTASAASSLNDGGGIKGGSISNQFASAASGSATPAAPAMTPDERQPVYATSAPAMAMG